MPSPGHIALILNPGSGAGSADQLSERVTSAFQAGGREVRITLAHSGTEISAAVRGAIAEPAATVVAGGGDGSVSAAAAAPTGPPLPLGGPPRVPPTPLARPPGL